MLLVLTHNIAIILLVNELFYRAGQTPLIYHLSFQFLQKLEIFPFLLITLSITGRSSPAPASVSSGSSTCSSTTDARLAEVRLNSGAGVVHDFLRLRADAIPGSAGGAVVNGKGEVVGMVAARRGDKSTLAVPAVTLRRVAKAILAGVSIRRALLGVTVFAPVGDSGPDRGVQVYGVVPGGPADTSGIRSGDLLFTYGGQQITDVSSLKKLVFESEPASPVEISLVRDQQSVTVRVQLGERSTQPPGQIVIRVSVPYLGVVPGDAIDDGVLVSDITARSPAALAGVLPGDVLTGIADNCVENSEMLRRVVRSYHSGARLTLELVRDGKKLTTKVVLSSRTAEAVIPGYDVPLLPMEWERELAKTGDAPRVPSRVQPVSFQGRTPSSGPLRSLHDQLEGGRK